MANVAGVDGIPRGWAVIFNEGGVWRVENVSVLSHLFDGSVPLEIVAIDVPIGLLDAYEIGGRACDREARALLQRRGSSVFPAPVRSVLEASSYEDACARSRASAPNGKAISRQTFAICGKIKEVDVLLRMRPELRDVVREVHPEVCFCELTGHPMAYSKPERQGREHRMKALRHCLPDLEVILELGQAKRLPRDDILDATAACWSALRLAEGKGRSLIEPIPTDALGLPMTIWV
jgi:predicted RNase H-like nuclease